MAAKENFSAVLSVPNQAKAIILPERVPVNVELTYPSDYQPDYDAMIDHLLRPQGIIGSLPFSLVEVSKKLWKEENAIKHEKLVYWLEPLLPGNYALTLLNVPFLPNDESHKLPREEAISNIAMVEVSLPDMRPLNLSLEAYPLLKQLDHEPIELASSNRLQLMEDRSSEFQSLIAAREIPWQLFAVILLMAAIALFLWKAASRPKAVLPELSKSYLAMRQAQEHLRMMPATGLDGSQVEAFIVLLTSGLKYYFEESCQMEALSKTTQEFLQNVEESPQMSREQKLKIGDFFKISDQIKFAKYQPSKEECEQAYEIAKQVLSNTRSTL